MHTARRVSPTTTLGTSVDKLSTGSLPACANLPPLLAFSLQGPQQKAGAPAAAP